MAVPLAVPPTVPVGPERRRTPAETRRAMAPETITAVPGRLDTVIARLTGTPRAEVQRAITAGRVTVDGGQRPRSYRLAGGELLTLDLPREEPLAPEPGPDPIRYQDAPLLVVA